MYVVRCIFQYRCDGVVAYIVTLYICRLYSPFVHVTEHKHVFLEPDVFGLDGVVAVRLDALPIAVPLT